MMNDDDGGFYLACMSHRFIALYIHERGIGCRLVTAPKAAANSSTVDLISPI